MQLTIKADSAESARNFCDALASFQPKLVDEGEGLVTVRVAIRGDGHLVEVLNAIQQHVTARKAGALRVDLGGHEYRLHASPSGAA